MWIRRAGSENGILPGTPGRRYCTYRLQGCSSGDSKEKLQQGNLLGQALIDLMKLSSILPLTVSDTGGVKQDDAGVLLGWAELYGRMMKQQDLFYHGVV